MPKTLKNKPKSELPSDEEILDFVIEMITFPFKSYMGGPDPVSGSISRAQGQKYYFNFEATVPGCVYAPTAREAIAKAMRLRAAQKKAADLIAQAQV